MGKISSEPEKETHFSHPHPLNKLITDHHQTLINSSSSCSGCNLKPTGVIYSCATCNFFLHKKCFEMPKKITHHFHKEHALTLLPEPAYPDGLFRCDACTEAGKGFSYHCKPCGVDLHILCAATPLSVAHASHAHKLELAFQPPYPTKDFACDVCRSPGADHWLYRCNPCGFDAHLSCVRTMVAPPPPPPPFAAAFSRSVPVPPQCFVAPPPPPMHHNFMAHPMMHNPAVGVPVGGATAVPLFGVSRQNDASVLQAIQQRVSNNQALTQAIMAGSGGGVGGGGLGGGGSQLQQMMQMISSFNNNSGGVVPGLNIFGGGGGGGGGQDMLQSLFSGGGGGNGLDFLGGGGLDFLGALGG